VLARSLPEELSVQDCLPYTDDKTVPVHPEVIRKERRYIYMINGQYMIVHVCCHKSFSPAKL